jgi:DNA polymerase-3 subunit beta
MKITCKQQDLSRGLSVVNHAVSSRSTLPILANILLTTDNGRLKLSATNLEIGINCWIDADVLEDGSTTVPAKTFSDLVGSLRQSQVELSLPHSDENDIVHVLGIKCAGTNSTIKGMSPEEFPALPTTEDSDVRMDLDARTLKQTIEQVAFAAADDDSRPVFTGVHVEYSEEQESITFAAADAFRLAVRAQPLSGSDANVAMLKLLIPAKTLSELSRILPNEGSVKMIVTENRSQVLFHTDNVDLVSRLIEGTFPNFRQIIPKEHTTRAVIETKEFAAAVKTVVPFARDSSNIGRVKIEASGSLTIEATAEDVGSNTTTINAAVEGPDQQIIFNVKYLSDVLAVLDTPELSLEVTSAVRPGVIKPVGATDYTYVIMPMNTSR